METIEHWIAVNEHGDRAASFDSAEDAVSTLIDAHGGAAFRTVKFSTAMELPTALEAAPVEILEADGDEAEVDLEEETGGEDEEGAPVEVHVPAEHSAAAEVAA
jgi:hypothetical protein